MSCIVLYSGGMDSTTLLYMLRENDPIAISFDYGQRHSKELEYAKHHTKKLGIEHLIIDLPVYKAIRNSALLRDDVGLPREQYTEDNQKVTVVPNRNMVMLSVAVAIAEDREIKDVYFAAHANDYAVYPDCRPEFVEAISRASELGTYTRVRIHAPFVRMTKQQIVKIGRKLGIDYEKTWSCYEGGDEPCGTCPTCRERLEALR